MTRIGLTAFLCLSVLASAHDVNYDYDRSADFGGYRRYQWVDSVKGRAPNQLMDQNIKRAIDSQLSAKGLHRVESGGDLEISYETAVEHEKQFNGLSLGPRWNGTAHVSTSTIDVGRLAVSMFDTNRKQLVWRGSLEKTLNIGKDPDKNYRNLEKAAARLLRNYPPGTSAN
jgi:hypothetical protein